MAYNIHTEGSCPVVTVQSNEARIDFFTPCPHTVFRGTLGRYPLVEPIWTSTIPGSYGWSQLEPGSYILTTNVILPGNNTRTEVTKSFTVDEMGVMRERYY